MTTQDTIAPVLLGIDQGTTSTRACLIDGDGRVVARHQLAHRQIHPAPGFVEHDADEIWLRTRQVIDAVLAGQKKPPRAVGLANQGETVLLWHKHTGRPLHNALVWQDTRGADAIDALARDADVGKRVADTTGLRLDAYFSASKLAWLLRHVPESQALADAGLLCAGTIDSWLIWNLTGGQAFVTDVSTAARTLLFDFEKLAYDPWLLELFAIPPHILPRVLPSVGAFGTVSGLGAHIDGAEIVVSLVDQPAALFGQGCLSAGMAKATYGTGCFVYLNTGSKPRRSQHGLLSTIVWQRPGEVTYALDGGMFAAGAVVTWLRDNLGLIANEADMEALAASVTDSAGVTCVPALAGLGAPFWQRQARAAWLGMGLNSTRAHLVRAALEGIAARVAQIVAAMERETQLHIPALRVDGGLSASSVLMQAQADMLGVAVEVVEDAEATVLGVCYLLARAVGAFADDAQVLRRVNIARTFHPTLSPAERTQRLSRFDAAVAHVVTHAEAP